jgi:hypothetical protein
MTWTSIPPALGFKRRCASKDCDRYPVAHFEHSGVGSDYCLPCSQRIERMRIKSTETNREIDELERVFGAIEDR